MKVVHRPFSTTAFRDYGTAYEAEPANESVEAKKVSNFVIFELMLLSLS